jgi:hypothetical protein
MGRGGHRLGGVGRTLRRPLRALLPLVDLGCRRDGRIELLVYEKWANDYGLSVRGDRGETELYRFSCGNV